MLEEAVKHFKLIVEEYIKVLGPEYSETIEVFD